MTNFPYGYQKAVEDFRDARFKATLQEILSRLMGKSNELLSYEDVEQKLKLSGRTEGGIREIPVSAIIGSVGRSSDFTRDFLPRSDRDKERWAQVKAVVDDVSHEDLPPIEAYKVGETYFVLDGNHRVSVARQEGAKYIDAHVIELNTNIPLSPDVQPEDLFIKAEYADFLEYTGIASLFPDVDLNVSLPGQYEKLKEHIQVHQYFMGIDFLRDIPYTEAVAHWYDQVYMPVVDPIRDFGLLHWFPGLTLTDLYLWVSEHRASLEKEVGWSIRPEAATADLASKESPVARIFDIGSWRVSKMYDRYTDRLFNDILVPLDGSENSWKALEQAIFLAKKENASLHGLHIISDSRKKNPLDSQTIINTFNQRCQDEGVKGNLIVEAGDVARKICERVLLTDLMVINVEHPPLQGLKSMGSGLKDIIRNSARPIMTVTHETSPMDAILLAFDDHPKSREALFVATYLAEKWNSKLIVLTIAYKPSPATQEYARSYLKLHEVPATFMVKKGNRETILRIVKEKHINLVLLGGYGGSPIKEFLFGSGVDSLLRKTDIPLLICQ